MIIPREIVDIAFAEPFRPFRINIAGGKSYNIRYPEIVQVGRSSLFISTPLLDENDDANGHPLKKVSYTSIESVELLDRPPATEGS